MKVTVHQGSITDKDWTTADRIRNGLADLGIKLEDTREGTIWKMQR
jgi:cysteinyl-tRNA synthetase